MKIDPNNTRHIWALGEAISFFPCIFLILTEVLLYKQVIIYAITTQQHGKSPNHSIYCRSLGHFLFIHMLSTYYLFYFKPTTIAPTSTTGLEMHQVCLETWQVFYFYFFTLLMYYIGGMYGWLRAQLM